MEQNGSGIDIWLKGIQSVHYSLNWPLPDDKINLQLREWAQSKHDMGGHSEFPGLKYQERPTVLKIASYILVGTWVTVIAGNLSLIFRSELEGIVLAAKLFVVVGLFAQSVYYPFKAIRYQKRLKEQLLDLTPLDKRELASTNVLDNSVEYQSEISNP